MIDKDIPVVILAGGKGKRFSPITQKIPKPMVRIANKPLLEYILVMFKCQGFKDFIFCLCYKKDKIIDYFGDGSKWGVRIKYVLEDENNPLGTAGALSLARSFLKATFIVTYGDILRNLDISEMLKNHFRKQTLVTLNIHQNRSQKPGSIVFFNKDLEVTKFIEKPKKIKSKKYVWSNGSCYIFEPEIFQFIEKDKFQDFGTGIFPALIKAKKPFYVYPSSDYLLDISNIEKLNQAKKDLKLGKYEPYDYS